jgi:hypothetical protein
MRNLTNHETRAVSGGTESPKDAGTTSGPNPFNSPGGTVPTIHFERDVPSGNPFKD